MGHGLLMPGLRRSQKVNDSQLQRVCRVTGTSSPFITHRLTLHGPLLTWYYSMVAPTRSLDNKIEEEWEGEAKFITALDSRACKISWVLSCL